MMWNQSIHTSAINKLRLNDAEVAYKIDTFLVNRDGVPLHTVVVGARYVRGCPLLIAHQLRMEVCLPTPPYYAETCFKEEAVHPSYT